MASSSKPKGRLSGAVWHADPCKVYCDPGHQLDGKQDKPLLTGAAGRLCATMAPGQTLRAAEREGLAYDIHRYPSWEAVPADMQEVITDNGVYDAHPRGYYCAMLSAWRVCTDKAWRQGQETEQACHKLCDSKQHAFLASMCTTTACRDETWRTAVFGK